MSWIGENYKEHNYIEDSTVMTFQAQAKAKIHVIITFLSTKQIKF